MASEESTSSPTRVYTAQREFVSVTLLRKSTTTRPVDSGVQTFTSRSSDRNSDSRSTIQHNSSSANQDDQVTSSAQPSDPPIPLWRAKSLQAVQQGSIRLSENSFR